MYMNGTKLIEQREKKGWNRAMLERKSGVSLRTIGSAERGGRVRPTTLRKLASALAVPPEYLLIDPKAWRNSDRFPFLDQQEFPNEVEPEQAEILICAAKADMKERPNPESMNFDSALRATKLNLNAKAEIIVKYATALDNVGRNNVALSMVTDIVENPRWQRIHPWIRSWAKYHMAIADRRIAEKDRPNALRHLDQAERRLGEILQDSRKEKSVTKKRQRTAARHQLGVIALERARRSPKKVTGLQHLEHADQHFMQAEKEWHKTSNYREGFAIRRRAEILELRGKRGEAIDLYLDALEIFLRFECSYYCDEIRAKLKNLLTA